MMRIGALPKILTKTGPCLHRGRRKTHRVPRLNWHRLSIAMRRNLAYTISFHISGLLGLPPTVKAEDNTSAARRVDVYLPPPNSVDVSSRRTSKTPGSEWISMQMHIHQHNSSLKPSLHFILQLKCFLNPTPLFSTWSSSVDLLSASFSTYIRPFHDAMDVHLEVMKKSNFASLRWNDYREKLCS